MNKNTLLIGGAIVLLLLGVGAFTGWQLHSKLRPCPEIITNTVTVTDPYWHHIADSLSNLKPEEKIKWLPRDTIKLPGDTIKLPADTATINAMLRDYLATYKYSYPLSTDTLDAVINTIVTKNKPIWYKLDYNIKIPFTTTNTYVDNSVTYNSYLQLGVNLPVYSYKPDSTGFKVMNKIALELTYTTPKFYIGTSWQPFDETISARLGTTIFKIKQVR